MSGVDRRCDGRSTCNVGEASQESLVRQSAYCTNVCTTRHRGDRRGARGCVSRGRKVCPSHRRAMDRVNGSCASGWGIPRLPMPCLACQTGRTNVARTNHGRIAYTSPCMGLSTSHRANRLELLHVLAAGSPGKPTRATALPARFALVLHLASMVSPPVDGHTCPCAAAYRVLGMIFKSGASPAKHKW